MYVVKSLDTQGKDHHINIQVEGWKMKDGSIEKRLPQITVIYFLQILSMKPEKGSF